MTISIDKFNERLDKFFRLKVLGRMSTWFTQFGAAFLLGSGMVSAETFRDAFKLTKILVERTDESGKPSGEEIDVDKLRAALAEAFTAVPEVVYEKEIDLLGKKQKVVLKFTKDDAEALYAELTA